MLPLLAIAATAAAAAAGKLIYDAVSRSDTPQSSPNPSRSEADQSKNNDSEQKIRTACAEISQDVETLLLNSQRMVQGQPKKALNLSDLRQVAAMVPHAGGLKVLAPLTTGLCTTATHRAKQQELAKLRADHQSLQNFILRDLA